MKKDVMITGNIRGKGKSSWGKNKTEEEIVKLVVWLLLLLC